MYIAVPNCQKGRTDQIGNNRKGDGRNQVHRAKREIENQEKNPNKEKTKKKEKRQENEKGESERIRNSREKLKSDRRYIKNQNSRMFDKNTQFHLEI